MLTVTYVFKGGPAHGKILPVLADTVPDVFGIEHVDWTPRHTEGEAIDVKPLGARLAHTKTVALFKSKDLELMRLVLLAGRSLPPHKVAGEITIQCIEGSIEVTAEERRMIDDMAPRLKQDGLVFVGLDVIGGKLTEVNVTSPTGIQQLSQHIKRDAAADVIEWVEKAAAAFGDTASVRDPR